jgi:2-hydroxychromene-2-carboxylate isomerase
LNFSLESAMARAEFWYDFASSYSYPAAMRVGAMAIERGVALAWRPFLLGPLFAAQGWRDSPFNLYPVKGRYMWRDLERVCAALGLPLKRPQPFPQNSLLAARVALALDEAARPAFTRAVYRAEFGDGRAIDAHTTIGALIAELGVAREPLLALAVADANKAALKTQTARAMELGLPGAPCLTTADGEVFWGNDRLEQGLEWVVAHDRSSRGQE